MNDDAAMTCAAYDVMHFSSDEVESGRALNEDTNASSSSVNDVSCHTQLAERDAADTARTGAHECSSLSSMGNDLTICARFAFLLPTTPGSI